MELPFRISVQLPVLGYEVEVRGLEEKISIEASMNNRSEANPLRPASDNCHVGEVFALN